MTRRRRKTDLGTFDPTSILDLDQIYKAINKVQLAKEEVTFIVQKSDSAVVSNILNDLALEFVISQSVKGCANCIKYHVKPSPDKYEDRDFDDVDQFPDEIAEEGQIFFD